MFASRHDDPKLSHATSKVPQTPQMKMRQPTIAVDLNMHTNLASKCTGCTCSNTSLRPQKSSHVLFIDSVTEANTFAWHCSVHQKSVNSRLRCAQTSNSFNRKQCGVRLAIYVACVLLWCGTTLPTTIVLQLLYYAGKTIASWPDAAAAII